MQGFSLCVALAKAKPRSHVVHQGRQPFSMPAHRAQHHPQCLQMFVGHIPQPKAQAALDLGFHPGDGWDKAQPHREASTTIGCSVKSG